jgi:phage host-nuclease inhibitor protein Gam
MFRNWEDFNKALRRVALIDLRVAEADQKRQTAILEITKIFEQQTAVALKDRADVIEQLEIFYRAHRKEVEAEGRRSMEFTYGKAGMRKGAPKLTLRKRWNWEKVKDALRLAFADGRFLRVKEDVDKEAVKAAALPEEQLAELGLRIVQEEEFWFETYPDRAADAAA